MKTARRVFVAAATGLLAFPALGQGAKSPPRVVFLSHSSPKAWGHLLDEFRAGLRSLGYIDGRDIILDVRWAENRLDRIPELIADALASRPAVIVTHGSPNVAALQKATSTVPIVFAAAGDPVRQGFVKSYRGPDTNITGVAFNMDIVPKVYELVKMAALVDKILKGGKPAEIPVEIPMRYEIAINLKTAQALGIKVPQAALMRAHQIIPA